MNKVRILDLFVEVLEAEAAQSLAATRTARAAATEAEAKPENKYDTRGLEQSYLADGQARRLQELQKSIHHFKTMELKKFNSSTPAEVSALVELQSDDEEKKWYFLTPERGGLKVRYENEEITSLSPESPLGEALFGKRVGESLEHKSAGKLRSYAIQSIC